MKEISVECKSRISKSTNEIKKAKSSVTVDSARVRRKKKVQWNVSVDCATVRNK